MRVLFTPLARLTALSAIVATAACYPAMRERHRPADPVLPVRDTVAAAWETGRRDAIRAYRPRRFPDVLALVPVSVMMLQSRDNFWMMPATVGAAGVVNLRLARRDRRSPFEAPDSMRTRYALGDTLWSAYRTGFESGSTQVRCAYRGLTVASTILGLAVTIPVMVYAPRN